MAQDYTNMSVHDKLKLADERLEKLKGTDKYDTFKERVDAMHAKYDPMVAKLGQNLENQGFSRDIAKDATWDYKNNQMGLGPIASERINKEHTTKMDSAADGFVSTTSSALMSLGLAAKKAEDTAYAVIDSTKAAARGVWQGARDTLAQTVKQAGQKATAQATQAAGKKVAGLTVSAAANMAQGNAMAEAITHFGLTGKEAAENAKVATDYFKAAKNAQTELTGIKTGIAAAGRNARVAAWNAGQQGLRTASDQAKRIAEGAVKAGGRAGLAAGAKTFFKSNAAMSFAIGGVTSAAKGATGLYGTIKATGGEGLGTAIKDTFTTKQGWKNLGLGLVGALRDVGNSMTGGFIENGDRTREKMMDDKGGDTHRDVRAAAEGGDAPRRADLSNFLATDEVPETLFGIPIVASPEQYTESDIAFFEEHPRAGGFYELGDEDTDTQAAEGAEGTSEELPRYYKVRPGDNLTKIARATGVSSADIAKYSKLADPNKIKPGQMLLLTEPYPGSWNNPGNVRWNSKVVREGETGKVKSKVSDGYFLTFDTPQNGLNAQAQVIGAIARSTIPERYQEGKLPNAKFTISNLINVYAPPKDKNDTPGYIKFVADELGVDKDAELNIDDAKQMASLLRAIVTRDSKPEYAEWFRDSEYAEAVKKMKTPAKDREKPRKKGK